MSKLSIVQLSDIHLSIDRPNPVQQRCSPIVETIVQSCWESDAIVLLFSGDIANTGAAAEYLLATEFVGELHNLLTDRLPNTPLHLLAVAGNHDCDFTYPSDARDRLLATLDSATVADDTLALLLGVQDNYEAFVDTVCDTNPKADCPSARLLSRVTLSLGEYRIRFNLINSAWMCQRRDKYGTLRRPPIELKPEPFDLSISVLHHPFFWFQPQDQSRLRDMLEASSDIVFTGHIHEDRQQLVLSNRGAHTQFVEGGALQPHELDEPSCFRILQVDLTASTSSTLAVTWNGAGYEHEGPITQHNLQRGNALSSVTFAHTQDFAEYLDDLGVALGGRGSNHLRLQDVFVYPDLQRSEATKAAPAHVVRSESVVAEIKSTQRLLLMGGESCGKTSLAKMLCRDLRSHGVVPLLVTADHSVPKSSHGFCDFLRSLAIDQYGPAAWERFTSLPTSARCIIVDDLHRKGRTTKQRNHFIDFLHSMCDVVILLSPQVFVLDELLGDDFHNSPLAEYATYAILEFGHRRRYDLVSRWMVATSDQSVEDEPSAEHRLQFMHNTISEALTRDYVPSYPLFILILLQSIHSQQRRGGDGGSYGHLYEAMIYQRLGDCKDAIDLDLKVNYLANLAHELHSQQKPCISESQASTWHDEFCTKYARRLDHQTILRSLRSVRVLVDSTDEVGFRYRYLYCFFLAKFIADAIHEEDGKQIAASLVKSIHSDASAHTLLCLCHLSKAPILMEMMRDRAADLFKDAKACDVLADTTIVSALIAEVPDRELPEGPRHKARQDLLDAKDAEGATPVEISQDAAGEDEVSEMVREMNASYRTIQIIGQILRSFSGSMKAETKQELTRECFDLAMRGLTTFLDVARMEVGELSDSVAESILRRFPDRDRWEIMDAVRAKVFFILQSFGSGMVKHISNSVGSRDLEPTFAAIRRTSESDSDDLVLLAIELDHYAKFPMTTLEQAVHKYHKSRYAFSMLQYLVWLHCILYDVKYDIRQQACELAQIRIPQRLLLLGERKRLPGQQASKR
ncbi:MAG: metallophosphoesterase [Phycisphaerales bacterium JB054]